MKVAILGGGGHAKVIADAILAEGRYELLGFFDDNAELNSQKVLGFPILGPLNGWSDYAIDGLIVGLGDNRARRIVFERVTDSGMKLVNVIHPRAVIARGVELGAGVVMFANVIVNPDTIIGHNVILNTACTVDHDCVVGSHAHLAPGCNLAGEVRVGEGVFAGVGTKIIPDITIGSWAIIGAGAVVTCDLPEGCKAVGVPARKI